MTLVRFVLVALLSSSFLLGGCRSRSKGTSAPGQASSRIGVAQCDDYLSKYARCLAKKVPAEQRPVLEEHLARMRAAWKTMAADPGVRPGLGQSCAMALENVRSSMQAFNCDW
jgi:outer membrane murein-binding lipoprotein Lpp